MQASTVIVSHLCIKEKHETTAVYAVQTKGLKTLTLAANVPFIPSIILLMTAMHPDFRLGLTLFEETVTPDFLCTFLGMGGWIFSVAPSDLY